LAEKIKLLFIGDIVGKPGFDILRKELKNFIDKYDAILSLLTVKILMKVKAYVQNRLTKCLL